MYCPLNLDVMYPYLPTGPGEYESQDSLGKGKPGLLCYHDKKRFKTVDNGVPGPGAYTVREVLVHVHGSK